MAVRAETGVGVARDASSDDESLLVQRLAAFDNDAWASLFDTYYKRLFRLAYVRTFQVPLSEDIASEVFAEAARGIKRYRYRGVPFRAWLYRIANNLIADHLRARARKPQVYLEEVEGVAAIAIADAFDHVEADVDFFQALRGLTDEQRTAMTLRFVNDLDLNQAAEVMGKSRGAVKQLQHRALLALRERSPEGGGA